MTEEGSGKLNCVGNKDNKFEVFGDGEKPISPFVCPSERTSLDTLASLASYEDANTILQLSEDSPELVLEALKKNAHMIIFNVLPIDSKCDRFLMVFYEWARCVNLVE
ncbi:unnamed protein product [Caenorhabditis sp. 36 PRJEB53466]|nr:unnamed protein product [Caenorhabditis sp. 36 PRJEB53466]